MAKNDYRSVLRDLKERRAKLDAAIEVMEGILGVIKDKTSPTTGTTTVIPSVAKEVTPIPVTTNGSREISMVDACYYVLKDAGEPLHAKVIAERVNLKYGKHVHY